MFHFKSVTAKEIENIIRACFHTVVKTQVEVWENEKLNWKLEGRVFPRYFEFSQTSTSVSTTYEDRGEMSSILICCSF